MNEITSLKSGYRLRVIIGLVILFIGLGLFILGLKPQWFGLDRSPVLGFIQIAVFMSGLILLCLGGFITMTAVWNGYEKSIAADIGLRLVATGLVIAFSSALSDAIGFGSHIRPKIAYFGAWQSAGVMLGELLILIGFIMVIPRRSQLHAKDSGYDSKDEHSLP
jgi:hypothetical protein